MRPLTSAAVLSSSLLLSASLGCQQVPVGLPSKSPTMSPTLSSDALPASVARVKRLPGRTIRASVDGDGAQGTESFAKPALSADGTCVAFISSTRTFGPGLVGPSTATFDARAD